MIADINIWRSAQQMVEQFGDDAPLQAAMRAEAMLEAGDLDGLGVWKRIKATAEELLRERPEGPVH